MSVNNLHYLAITAIGPDRIDLLDALTKIAKQCGCNILESRLYKAGEQCVMMFHLSGSWSAIAKIEAAVPAFAEQQDLAVQLKRTAHRKPETALPYQVQVTAHDRPGILNELANFFNQQGIMVDQVDCQTYQAKNHTAMTNIQLMVDIPIKQHIATIRERFMVYCEDRNLDAMIEPHK